MTKLKVVNLTPHSINIVDAEGVLIRELPSEGLARVSSVSTPVGVVDQIPVIKQEFGKVQGLPTPEKGVYYIVSAMVGTAAAKDGRTDLLGPAEFLRDQDGNILGCKALQAF